MFLPPDLFARADAEPRRHTPAKPPAVAVIICILVAVVMMLTPLFYGKRILRQCFTTRVSHTPHERIVCFTPEALELMPVTKYRTSREGKHSRAWKKGANIPTTSFERSRECSICTEEFLEDVRLRSLPCGHRFHPDCIDPWFLERSITCPMCRANAAVGILTTCKMPARPRRVLFITEPQERQRSITRGFRGSPSLHYCLNHSVRRARHSNPSATFSSLSDSCAGSCGSLGAGGLYFEVTSGVSGVGKWKGEDVMG